MHASIIDPRSSIIEHRSSCINRAEADLSMRRMRNAQHATHNAQSCMSASHTCARVYIYMNRCAFACLRDRTYATRACTIAHCAYAAWTSLRLHVRTRDHAYAHVCMVAYLPMGMSNATQSRYVCMVAYLPMGMCKRAFTYLRS
jgi:hypothetical protein